MSQEERGAGSGGEGAKKHVVFCVDGRRYGQPGYAFFTHEADVMMVAAASEVESGKLAPAEAREILEPYRGVLPPLYTGEQRMVFDPGRFDWDNPDSFPTAEAVLASPQASQIFWYEVDELGIDGVALVWSEPFPVLAPVRNKALEELKEAISDEYEIVVKKDIDEFHAIGKSVEWARELIEDSTRFENEGNGERHSEALVFAGRYFTQDYFDESSSELVNGDIVYVYAPYEDREEYLGMEGRVVSCNHPEYTVRFEDADENTFPRESLELAYRLVGEYIDDDVDQLAVGDMVRIYLVDDESEADLLDAAGHITSATGDRYTVNLDGSNFSFRRDQIELMPTGYNPHYVSTQEIESTTHTDASSSEKEQNQRQLIYGDGGQEGLVFLEEDYIAELKDFLDALHNAGTWGELRDMVSEERYQETLAVWEEHELRRLKREKSDEEEVEFHTPNPDDDFDIENFPSYHDGDFPEFAPTMMDRWVDEEIIDEYGGYGATTTGYTATINFENEEKVVSLLEEKGYVCIRDDEQIWAAVWRQ